MQNQLMEVKLEGVGKRTDKDVLNWEIVSHEQSRDR